VERATKVAKPYSAKLFFQTVIARAYPRVVGAQREKSWMFFDIFLPLLAVAAYVFVYRAIGAPETYVGFVVMGGAMTAFWLNILWSMSSQLFWEKVQFTVASFSALFGTFTLTMVALYGMGMMFSSLFLLLNREAWHLASLAQEPIYLLSGFYFPLKSLGFWLAAGASIIPLAVGMDAMRQLVFPAGPSFGFLSVPIELGILGVLSVVFLVGARYLLEYMERLAIREGRLTDSRR
jgi:ABC-2 type transport system permease protein